MRGYETDNLPEKRWLIEVLGHLKPEDEIFKKDYVAPPRKNKTEEYKTIELPPTFLQQLPLSQAKTKKRRLKLVGQGLAE